MNYELKYFKKSDKICLSDFESENKIEWINLDYLLSLSDLGAVYFPFTGGESRKCALVTMSNNDKYYIRESEFNELQTTITKL